MLVTLNIHALEAHPCVVNAADILQSGDIQEGMLPIAKADPELHARSSKVIYPMSSLLAGTPDTAPFIFLDAEVNWKQDSGSPHRDAWVYLELSAWRSQTAKPLVCIPGQLSSMALWKPTPASMDLKTIWRHRSPPWSLSSLAEPLCFSKMARSPPAPPRSNCSGIC